MNILHILPSLTNSDSKASLKRQKSPETTMEDTGYMQVLFIIRVKCSYFEIFVVVNRPYFGPHTIPYKVFKFSYRVRLNVNINIADSISRYFNLGRGHYFVLKVKEHVFDEVRFF